MELDLKRNSRPEDEVRSLDELCARVRAYNPGADIEMLRRAYLYSSEAHGLQKRSQGTPYMDHPLAVASILAEMKMDVVTIAAGLLHDTIEDTEVTVNDLKKLFGYELAFLVDALTKLSRMEFKSRAEAQAESFRKMLLSMSEDIRVILIKFADRLHNLRTLEFLSEDRRTRIAQETLEIYAPLANRLGIGWLKSEFEDLSFKYSLPAIHEDIVNKVKKKRSEYKEYVKALTATIRKKLKDTGIPCQVYGRVKHYYGIYQKMQNQGIPFEQVYDVLGIRIITDTKSNCYALIGTIHSLYKPVPGKFKDYIAMPKSNLYQSLHTTVIGPGGERVEFQIRTEEMHRLAEEGIASHWKYKEKGAGFNTKDDRYVAWLRDLVQSQQETGQADARSFIEAVKSEVVQDVIFVFTPKGDIRELPDGSTPIDFAYSIHTEVGHRCVGARIDGKMVPLRQKLPSGATVEILTSNTHRPSRDWLKFVVTPRAKARIKQWLKVEERRQSVELGQRLLEEELKKHGLSITLIKSDEMKRVADGYKFESAEDVLAEVGYGKLSAHQVVNRLKPEAAPNAAATEPARAEAPPQHREAKGITINGIDDVLYHTAKCCYPVAGDDLVGFITRGQGVAVHRRDCKNLERLAADEARLLEVQWRADNPDVVSLARLAVDTIDKPGVIAALSATLSAAEINIAHLEAITSNQERKAKITFVIEVKDKKQLARIMNLMSQTEGVIRVTRY